MSERAKENNWEMYGAALENRKTAAAGATFVLTRAEEYEVPSLAASS